MHVTLALHDRGVGRTPRERATSLANDRHVVYRPAVSTSAAVPHIAPHERRVTRCCVRPGCSRRATTTLGFDYAGRVLTLDPLGPAAEPGAYDLCFHHAARSTPPTGWTLRDRAPSRESVTEAAPPVGPDRGHGVARLAAALSAVQRAVSEDAPDAAPDGTDRSGAPVRLTGTGSATRASGSARLDGLLQPSTTIRPVPLSERTAEVEVRPVPQSLRLAPDPTTTVWCAGLLAPSGAPTVIRPTTSVGGIAPVTAVRSASSLDAHRGAPTLFG